MDGNKWEEILYQRYFQNFDARHQNGLPYGMEFERHLTGAPNPATMTACLAQLGGIWGGRVDERDSHGGAVSLVFPDGTAVGFDTTYCNLEISVHPAQTLGQLEQQLHLWEGRVLDIFGPKGYGFSQIAVNLDSIAREDSFFIPRDDDHVCCCERQVLAHLPTQVEVLRTHPYPFSLTASQQTHHLSTLEGLPVTLNALFSLDYLVLLLFSNSPVQFGTTQFLDGRYHLCENSGFLSLNTVGTLAKPFETWYDVLERYSSGLMSYRVRNHQVELLPRQTAREYFQSPEARPEDVAYYFSYFNSELSIFGTVEHRLVDTQPGHLSMVPGAFLYGLMANKEETWERMQQVTHDLFSGLDGNELCHRAITAEGAKWMWDQGLERAISPLLSLAESGLKPQDKGYLTPLFQREGLHRSPGWERLHMR